MTLLAPELAYIDGCLYLEGVALDTIANQYGTPCYVYSRAALTKAYLEYIAALTAHPAGQDALVCYAVKANSNLAILNVFARLGAGFDIVSGGELSRVLAAGGDPSKVVFSGVGKTTAEMRQALEAGIRCFNVESAPELERLNAVAGELGKQAPISLRVNPDVDPKTHPYISTGLKENKFGVAFDEAEALYAHAAALPYIAVAGIDCHIGSQILDPSPFAEALDKILSLVDRLTSRGIALRHVDIGGGLGIRYQTEDHEPKVSDYLNPLLDKLTSRGLSVIMEPGRRLVGNAGLLLTTVEYLKPNATKSFAIVDAAMNDLARPALYDAWHEIVPVRERSNAPVHIYEIVGPVCESGDFLGHNREFSLIPGDRLVLQSAGAYGMAMSSNYNTRPRAAEVMVDGSQVHLIRRRESIAELYAGESILP